MNEMDEAILFGESTAPFPSPNRKLSRTGNLLEATNMPVNTLDHSPTDPLINALRKARYTVQSCPGLWTELANLCPDRRAVLDEHMCDEKVDLTFGEMDDTIRRSAAAFSSLGVEKGVNVAILGENSANWLIADHGIQLAGGASSVRGADAPLDELRYIYEHSDSKNIAVLQGPALLTKLTKDAELKGLDGIGLSNESHGPVKTIILLNKEKKSLEDITNMSQTLGIDVHVISELVENTPPLAKKDLQHIGKDDLSTIVYTSGTTGRPKGVMLTHGNLLHQIGHRLGPNTQYDETEPIPGEKMLSLLPVWHITERTFELWVFARGCSVVYTNIRHFKDDLAKHKPEWMVLVPRVLEKVASGVQNKFSAGSVAVKSLVKLFTATGSIKVAHKKIAAGLVVGDNPGTLAKIKSKAIVAALSPLNAIGDKLVWSKVKAGFGGQQKMIVSGGSALAGSLESFYEICGIPIVVGYGLTECSPLLSHRRSDNNLVTAGCVGKPCIDTEVRVVDQSSTTENGERKSLPAGEIGVVLGRGPQVMRGYYKNREATHKAVDSYGWFDTGDLGKINPATGDLILTGRCKDTIVLSNGENIEPVPIEDAIMSQSDLVEQLMVGGQDGKSIMAIAVLSATELAKAGYLDESEGKKLQKLNEVINNPKCTDEEAESASKKLNKAADQLRSDASLVKALKDDMKKACAGFRPWEQVGKVYITLEPFAMTNGLLTQSYKVKRDVVADRYMGEF